MADEPKTFQLRYVGTRFEGARLPLDVLSDLTAFRDLLVLLAKKHWRATNADRQRLPKGFDTSISLDLIAIEHGSAMPKLAWRRDTAQAAMPWYPDDVEVIVDASYAAMTKLIDNAGQKIFPQTLSAEAIRALNKLGSSLRADEKIEFVGSRGADGKVVYLDTHRRKELITHVHNTYEQRYEGVGELSGSHDSGKITVRTNEYGELTISVDPDSVASKFDGNMNSPVQFALQIELDNSDKVLSIIEVFSIDVIDNKLSENIKHCLERLEDIFQLKAGWLDGEGISPTALAVEAAKKLLQKRPEFAGSYKIFPTPQGGVLFEMEVRGWDLSVEFNDAGHAEMYGVEIDGPSEMEPKVFENLGDEFIGVFDQHTAPMRQA